MSAVCIKPRIVQNICLALMGPRGWLLCQLSDPRSGCGFRGARPLYCPDQLPGNVGAWPDALADDFRTDTSISGHRRTVACEWRGAIEGMHGTAASAASRSNGCRIVSGCEAIRHAGEHVVAGVIARSKELPLRVTSVPPCAERREGRPINADHFVGVVGLAACFVPRLAPRTTVLGEPASPTSRGLERRAELAI